MRLFLFSITLLSFLSKAQAQPLTPREELKSSEQKTLGWKKTGSLGLNLSFTSSHNVVGQTDGTSDTLGLNLKSTFTRITEQAEWRNSLSLVELTTRTPSVPRYVKSNDELKFESLYLHALKGHPQWGPYAKFDVTAPLFFSEDVRSQPTVYQIDYRNQPDITRTDSSLRLTDGLRPLSTKESFGAFYKSAGPGAFSLELRAGVGALQVRADGQLAVTGTDSATGAVRVKELTSVNQAGLELGARIKGSINSQSAYEAGLESMTPFVNNKESGDDRDAVRLTNIEGFAKLSAQITSWSSMAYDYRLKIQPQVVDRTQQTHMMVLNLNYNLF